MKQLWYIVSIGSILVLLWNPIYQLNGMEEKKEEVAIKDLSPEVLQTRMNAIDQQNKRLKQDMSKASTEEDSRPFKEKVKKNKEVLEELSQALKQKSKLEESFEPPPIYVFDATAIKELDKIVANIDQNLLPKLKSLNEAASCLRMIVERILEDLKSILLSKKPVGEEFPQKLRAALYYVYKHSRNAQWIVKKILAFLSLMTAYEKAQKALQKLLLNIDLEREEGIVIYSFSLQDVYNDIRHLFLLSHLSESRLIFEVKDNSNIVAVRFYNDITLIVATNKKLYFLDTTQEKEDAIGTRTIDFKLHDQIVAFDWYKDTLAVAADSKLSLYKITADALQLQYTIAYDEKGFSSIFFYDEGQKIALISTHRTQKDSNFVRLVDLKQKKSITLSPQTFIARAALHNNTLMLDTSNSIDSFSLRSIDLRSISFGSVGELKEIFILEQSTAQALKQLQIDQFHNYHFLGVLKEPKDEVVYVISPAYLDIELVSKIIKGIKPPHLFCRLNPSAKQLAIGDRSSISIFDRLDFASIITDNNNNDEKTFFAKLSWVRAIPDNPPNNPPRPIVFPRNDIAALVAASGQAAAAAGIVKARGGSRATIVPGGAGGGSPITWRQRVQRSKQWLQRNWKTVAAVAGAGAGMGYLLYRKYRK